MPRKRYVQNPDPPYELIEVTDDYVAQPRNHDAVLWNDRSYDGIDPRFNSRTQHREFMRRTGLTTADDFKGTWDKARSERERVYKGEHDRGARREAVERAFLNPRRR